MATIYEPSGKAREYSPLALNLYNGCDHSCKYCYVNNIPGCETSSGKVSERPNIINSLRKDALKMQFTNKQVLLSFTGDPYCQFNNEAKLTRQALLVLLACSIPVSVLTKGGERCLQDIDVFKRFGKHIKIGATLTLTNEERLKGAEPGASSFASRIIALKNLHDSGIKTWVSLEPVIDAKESLAIIDITKDHVDEYRVGKLNHFSTKTDWRNFGISAAEKIRAYNKQLYVKYDLRLLMTGFPLSENEINCDNNLAEPFPSDRLEL